MTLFLPTRNDILVQSSEGEFVAVIEIKNMQDLSCETATAVRHNSMVYSLLPQTPYFLLLSQDRGFLWKDAWREGPETPPTYEFPMDNVITRYLKREFGKRLYNTELEFLTLQWLNDLADGKQQATEEPEKTLALAGFYELLKGATVRMNVGEAA